LSRSAGVIDENGFKRSGFRTKEPKLYWKEIGVLVIGGAVKFGSGETTSKSK